MWSLFAVAVVVSEVETDRSWVVGFRDQVYMCEAVEPCPGVGVGSRLDPWGKAGLMLSPSDGSSPVDLWYYPDEDLSQPARSCRVLRCRG
jgi:hypothetical protein